jgi:hypothetical protein
MTTVFYSLSARYQKNICYSAYAFELNCLDHFDKYCIVVNDAINSNDFKNYFVDHTQTNKKVEVINDCDAFEILNFKTKNHDKFVKKHPWYYQQVFKLHADILSNDDIICVTDPDCFTLKPFNLFKNNKLIVNHVINWYIDEVNVLYNIAIPRYYFSNNEFSQYHFQSELMPTTSKYLKSLRNFIGDFCDISPLYPYTSYVDQIKYNELKGDNWPTTATHKSDLPLHVIDELDQNDWFPFLSKPVNPIAEWTLHAHYLCRTFENEIYLNPIKAKTNRIVFNSDDDGTFDIYKDWADHDDEAFYLIFNKKYQNFSI